MHGGTLEAKEFSLLYKAIRVDDLSFDLRRLLREDDLGHGPLPITVWREYHHPVDW